jgi:hypothetical protein
MVPSADAEQRDDPSWPRISTCALLPRIRRGRFANFLTKSQRTSMPASSTAKMVEAVEENPEIRVAVKEISYSSARTLA